jgi:gliding motility-associated-like protein
LRNYTPLFYFLSALFCLFVPLRISTQVTVATGQTPQQYVQNVLLGAGAQVSNVSFQGNANTQIGSFNGAASNLGLGSGLVLSTCQLNPPNGLAPGQWQMSAQTPGNQLLTNLIGLNTNNCSMLTFDFVPLGDTIKFRYVFASSEYNNYVNTSFNDVFAFFLTGPNPTGPAYNNTNVAIIPGTTNTPVTINNVNNGNSWGCGNGPCMNCQFFVDNCNQNQGHNFGGATVAMWASARVVPCSTYTIRLGVADAVDGALNSAVFLEGGSFQSNNLSISVSNNTTSAIDTILNEGCGTAQLTITRTGSINTSLVVNLNITGTATNGVDYQQLPTQVTFNPGQTSVTLTISPILDNLVEGMETIVIGVQGTGCNNSSAGITFLLYDYFLPVVDAGPNMTIDCTGALLSGTLTNGAPGYTYNWNNGAGNSPTYFYIPNASGFVPFVVTDTCGNSSSDSLYVTFLSPNTSGFGISVSPESIVEGCGNATFTITRNVGVENAGTFPYQITGTATNGSDYPQLNGFISFAANQTSATINVTGIVDAANEPNESLIITIVDTLCDGTTVPFTATLTLRDYVPMTLDVGPDIVVNCPRFTSNVNPVFSGGWPNMIYSWSSGENTLNLQNILPPQTTNYALTITDSCGKSISDNLTITVFNDPVANFVLPEGPECEIFTYSLINNSSPGSGTDLLYQWNLGNGQVSTLRTPTVQYSAGQYTVSLKVTNAYNCVDSISKNITILPTPIAQPVASPQNTTILNPLVTLTDMSLGNVVGWYWETGDGVISTLPSFEHTYSTPGTYSVLLVITNEFGCTGQAYLGIDVKNVPAIYIPNTFTPNEDNINDGFTAKGMNIVEFEMWIFDRWGDLLYYTDKHNKPWMGSKNNSGDLLKQDAYVYKIRIRDLSGIDRLLHGNVNLLR